MLSVAPPPQIRRELPQLLVDNRVSESQDVLVEECDYDLQLSLFFSDPDSNIVGTWW